MKKIEAIIKPHKLDDVIDQLIDIGIQGVSVSEIRGFGHEKDSVMTYTHSEYVVDFLPRLKLEVVIVDTLLEASLTAIKTAAYTGEVGDGKIFVYPVEKAIRIRTGELDENAL